MTEDQFDKAKQLQREIEEIERTLSMLQPRTLSEFDGVSSLFGQRERVQPGKPALHDSINSLVSDSLRAIIQKSVIEELTQLLAFKRSQFADL